MYMKKILTKGRKELKKARIKRFIQILLMDLDL